jgi:hypothetical protein
MMRLSDHVISRRQFAIGAVMATAGDGLRRPLNAPQAGQVSYGIPPNSSGVIVARQVIVSGPVGNATGVFVYAPGTTPGLGNPPITWESSGLVDPFGNVLPSTTGVAGTGTFQAGDTVINTSGEFVYSAAPALGDLADSIARAGGTDQFGNAYYQGVFSYSPSGGAVPLFGAGLQNGNLLAGTGAALAGTGGRTPSSFASGGDGIAAADSGLVSGADQSSSLTLKSQAAAGNNTPVAVLNGGLGLLAVPAQPSGFGFPVVYPDSAGNAAVVNSSDGLRYVLGSRVVQTVATITVNLASPGSVLILAPNVGAASYQFEFEIVYISNQAAGTPTLLWGGTSTISQVIGHSEFVTQAAGGITGTQVFNGAMVTGTGPVLGAANTKYAYTGRGNITFSGAGSFTLSGQTSVAADTWQVASGSYIKLVPTS